MKKTFRFLIAALALMGIASCADVPELPYPTPDPNGGGGGGTTVGGLPFTSNSLNDFEVKTVEGIDWSLGSSYAKASGYANGATTATKTWLVSPAINTTITGADGVSIAFDNVLRYVKSSTDLKGWHKVLASKDYAGDVTTATWTDLNFQPVESATQTWDFYAANPVSLPAELLNQEKVFIAFYFQCDGTNSTTWELKNFTVKEGMTPDPTPGPGPGGDGDGSETSPFNVAYVRSANNPGTTAWVKGYIVGTVKDGGKTYSDAVIGLDNASNTNILLADAADCDDPSLCIPVQLPSGSVRNDLSLQQHPENLGKQVWINGKLEAYFGQTGIKSPSKYSWDGNGGGDDPGPTPGDALFSADFTQSDGGFKAYDVELGGLNYVWQQTSSYGWKASAYLQGNHAASSLLISPVIDLTSVSSATLTFSHAANYLNGADCTDFLGVYVSTRTTGGDIFSKEGDGTVTKELSVPTWPSGSDWNYVDSGDISLNDFVGNKIVLAFQYNSTTTTAPTWEIKSLTVK